MTTVRQGSEIAIKSVTVVGVLAAAPYAMAVLGYSLWALAKESYPRAVGLEWSSDSSAEFPHGGAGIVIAVIALAIGVAMVAGLVLTVRRNWIAKWATIAWLVLVLPVAFSTASHPGESRRCFVDGYSGQQVCASAQTVTIRNFATVALPALIAIACLLATPTHHLSTHQGVSWCHDSDEH